MTDATPSSPLTNAGSNHGVYENLCPYRLFDKKYRFFEEFSEYVLRFGSRPETGSLTLFQWRSV